MEIIELDPATAAGDDLAGWHDVLCAVVVHDLPGDPQPILADTVTTLKHPFEIARQVRWLARVDGTPAAACELRLDETSNHEVGDVDLSVAPAFRRRGLGRALLAKAIRQLTAEGRPTVTAEVLAGTAGEPFAQGHGFTCALTEQRGILRLADSEATELDSLVAALPAGYQLNRWTGQVPASAIESYVQAKDLSWLNLVCKVVS